jgi:hypothetical protein
VSTLDTMTEHERTARQKTLAEDLRAAATFLESAGPLDIGEYDPAELHIVVRGETLAEGVERVNAIGAVLEETPYWRDHHYRVERTFGQFAITAVYIDHASKEAEKSKEANGVQEAQPEPGDIYQALDKRRGYAEVLQVEEETVHVRDAQTRKYPRGVPRAVFYASPVFSDGRPRRSGWGRVTMCSECGCCRAIPGRRRCTGEEVPILYGRTRDNCTCAQAHRAYWSKASTVVSSGA